MLLPTLDQPITFHLNLLLTWQIFILFGNISISLRNPISCYQKHFCNYPLHPSDNKGFLYEWQFTWCTNGQCSYSLVLHGLMCKISYTVRTTSSCSASDIQAEVKHYWQLHCCHSCTLYCLVVNYRGWTKRSVHIRQLYTNPFQHLLGYSNCLSSLLSWLAHPTSHPCSPTLPLAQLTHPPLFLAHPLS